MRAVEDKTRRTEWIDWAKVWNELAEEALGRPSEETDASHSNDLAQSNLEKVE